MPIARKHLVDDSIPGCFHCISRCVRRAFLCGDDAEHRRDWVRETIRSAAEAFAVDVLAYAVMSNHLHLVVRTDPVRVADWSADTVARRWATAHPCTGAGLDHTDEAKGGTDSNESVGLAAHCPHPRLPRLGFSGAHMTDANAPSIDVQHYRFVVSEASTLAGLSMLRHFIETGKEAQLVMVLGGMIDERQTTLRTELETLDPAIGWHNELRAVIAGAFQEPD